ncbi:BA14K family protein [Bartonella sp. B35(2025)]
MVKLTKLAVLSAVSTVTALAPSTMVLADSTIIYNEYTTRSVKTSPPVSHSIPSINHYNVQSILSKHHPFGGYNVQSILSQHHPFYSDNKKNHHHADRQSQVKNNYHIEHKTYKYVEKKTHHYIHNPQISNNASDTLAAGILGLAAGAVLGNILKQPQQPQIIYQAPPRNQVIYQKEPQKQVVYQAQQTTGYQPIQQPWTAGWLEYCKKKYRSFNPKTGTFRGYDGLDHFCYAPLK